MRMAPFLYLIVLLPAASPRAQTRPNIVFIYSDDLGYGDVGCYGATAVRTPNVDRLAAEGLRFTNGHSEAATCTPSRFSFVTGLYSWRKKNTGIARGNAGLIIPEGTTTVASVLTHAGYRTGIVGKWHLGLGGPGGPDWNGNVGPGPLELGFAYSYIIPATLDRVPTVYIDGRRVAGLDPKDPLFVSYDHPVGDEPTGKDHPELLRYPASHGHDQTIVNGIGRIGYMAGGRSARWVDETVAQVLARKAVDFIAASRAGGEPFFLYYALTDIHVPHWPNRDFVNTSGLGLRGDAIVQMDWCVGQVLHALDSLGLADNTLVIFSSDNGPVVDDGYADGSVERLGGHRPAGVLRGGKYSRFEGGTRVPFIVRWPGQVKPGVSDALVCQIDFLRSFARLTGQPLGATDGPDSFDVLDALLGRSSTGRPYLPEDADGPSVLRGRWKYIPPYPGGPLISSVQIETGNLMQPQLYDLLNDLGERHNVAAEHPEVVRELDALLRAVTGTAR